MLDTSPNCTAQARSLLDDYQVLQCNFRPENPRRQGKLMDHTKKNSLYSFKGWGSFLSYALGAAEFPSRIDFFGEGCLSPSTRPVLSLSKDSG